MTESLPDVGMLCFFYDREQSAWGFDPNHKEGFRLWYFPEVSQLTRSVHPEASKFPCARVSFEPFLSLPDSSSASLRALLLALEMMKNISSSFKNTMGKHLNIKYSAGRTLFRAK